MGESKRSGRIHWYSEARKYGFIRTKTKEEIFFHINDTWDIEPIVGVEVEFEHGRDKKGRLKAIEITGVSVGKGGNNGKPAI